MKLKYSIKTAVNGLRTHKSRSFLTILGIVIGITSIILMMSIGQGAQDLILNQISGLGAETLIVRPGREPKGPTDVAATLLSDSLKKRDLELLKKKGNVPDLVDITPLVMVTGSVSYEGETYRPTTIGSSLDFLVKAFGITLEQGDLFGEDDIRQLSSVAVIGSKVKTELFGGSDAVGKYIKIKERKFRVAGVLAPKGQVAFLNTDELVVVPYTTAQTYLLGVDHFFELIVRTTGPDAVKRAVRDVEATLREAHNIDDPEKDDFYIETQQGVADQVRTIMSALTAFLSSVVAIALVVGGIGVMNIMLVSVTERTREIGLRKALGARTGDILQQFLFEAVILTGIGGLIGIFLGTLFSFLVSLVLAGYLNLDWQFSFPVSAAVMGILVSTLVGLVFGIYPARQASRKSPIEALRYE